MRNLKITLPYGHLDPKQAKTHRPMTPKSLADFEKTMHSPLTTTNMLTTKRTSNLLIKVSPKVTRPRDTPSSITTRIQERSPVTISLQSSPTRRSFVKLKKPGTTRVTTQSLKSINFSKIRIDPDGDEDAQVTKRLHEPLMEQGMTSLDEIPQQTCGVEAVEQFYTHYKQLDKVCDINGFKNVKNSMYTTFLRKTEDLKLLPSKIGLVKGKGASDMLKINNFRIGDKYAAVLSEGLRSSASYKQLELANNRLTPAGADSLLSQLQSRPEVIDLSGNNIGKIGCEHLCSIINQRNSRLRYINLEGNKLGDYAVADLCEAIGDNETIKKLNMSRNFLTNKAAEDIGRMLRDNSSLEELYLMWNQIKGKGGEVIVEAMGANPHIRVLDLSWNSLGLVGGNFAQVFASFIAQDEMLVHLDLSNNYFKKNDAQIIAKGLESNHTLYGFHFQGNVGYVDPKGFLIVEDNAINSATIQSVLPPINGVDVQPEVLKRYHQITGEYRDACWVCEGWRPVEVCWEPGVSGSADQDPIYCHFAYEGYQPRYLNKKNGFYNARMAPPIGFGFLFNVEEGQLTCAENLDSEEYTGSDIKLMVNGKVKKFKPEFENWMPSCPLRPIVDKHFEVSEKIAELGIKPRVLDEVYIPPEIRIERPKWRFQASSFRDYRPDNQALLDRCFEVDWENTRISKLVKNEDDLLGVRALLEGIYKHMKDCYKHYAAIGAPSEIWSIPLNTYTEFCLSSGIVDGKLMKLSDFDRVFIATYTKTDKQKNPRNPERAIVRYQFMEGLVRMADQKYITNGLAGSYKEALGMMLDENVKPFISKFNHQNWRVERYWNEEVDCVVKSYTPILKGAYKKYSGLKTLPGQKKFMSLEEFNGMVGSMDLLTDGLGERDATLFFSLAMMTQVDELDSDRIFQMQYIEFVEALARAADKYSAAPYGKREIDIPYDQRVKQPLHVKLEGIMQRLYSVCGADVKDIWIMPETTIFEIEEEKGKQKVFTKKRKIMRVDPTDPGSLDYYGLN